MRITASAAGNARGSSTLMHELTHHFVASRKLGRVPAWCNEGVAQQVTQLAGYDAPLHCGGGHGVPLGELGDGFFRFEQAFEAAYGESVQAFAHRFDGEQPAPP